MLRGRCATFVDLLLTRVLFDAEDRIVVVAGDALHFGRKDVQREKDVRSRALGKNKFVNCSHVILSADPKPSGSVPIERARVRSEEGCETCFAHHFCASFQLFCADLHRHLRRPDLPALEPSAQHVVLRQHHPGHRQLQGALPSSGRRFRLSSLLIGRARSFSSLAGQPLQAVPAWHGVCLLGTCRTAHRAACPLPLHTSPWLVLCCAVRGAERCC